MADTPKFQKRSLVMDFLEIPDPDGLGMKAWHLLGTGFDKIDRSPNAQTMTVRFVNEDSDTTITTGYQESLAVTLYELGDDVLIETLLDVSRKRLIGEGTIFKHRRVYLNAPYRDSTGDVVPNKFKAYEELVNVNVGDESTRDNLLGASLTLTFVSDFVFGAYSATANTFTPDGE